MTKNIHKPLPLRFQIAFLTITRVILQSNTRMLYPFLATFARGLGITIVDISLAATARSMTAAIVPFLTPLSDRFNRKTGMISGVILFILGNMLVVLKPTFPIFILSICISFLGSFLFIPSLQAYLGDRVAYKNRARAIGIVELGWSLSFIIGMPIIGFLIARFGWLSPFKASILMGTLGLAIIILVLPSEGNLDSGKSSAANYKHVFTSRPALIALLMGFAFTMANEVVALFFGVWLEDSFGLQIAALGAASMVIGFAELGGESLTTFLTDKLGKKRSVRIGLIANCVFVLILPWIGTSVIGAMIGLFLFFLTFEYTMVSYLPLMTEILPSARATFLGISIAAMSLGRAGGAALAPWLYKMDFIANSLAAIILNMLALILLKMLSSKQTQ